MSFADPAGGSADGLAQRAWAHTTGIEYREVDDSRVHGCRSLEARQRIDVPEAMSSRYVRFRATHSDFAYVRLFNSCFGDRQSHAQGNDESSGMCRAFPGDKPCVGNRSQRTQGALPRRQCGVSRYRAGHCDQAPGIHALYSRCHHHRRRPAPARHRAADANGCAARRSRHFRTADHARAGCGDRAWFEGFRSVASGRRLSPQQRDLPQRAEPVHRAGRWAESGPH